MPRYIMRSIDRETTDKLELKLKTEQILDDPQFKIRSWHRDGYKIHIDTNLTWIEIIQLFPAFCISIDEQKQE